MTASTIVRVQLPGDFDMAAYYSVNTRAATLANPNLGDRAKKDAWHAYASAWNGVAYRLRAARDYDDEFSRSISETTAPDGEDRYVQERALFGCITSALSALECFFMAAYSVGAVRAPKHFPLQDAAHLVKNPQQVSQCYGQWLGTAAFPLLLRSVLESPRFKALADLRNALAHRGVLPRLHFLSSNRDTPSAVPANPKALASDFDYTAHLTDQTTNIHVAWLVQTLNSLMRGFDVFLAD